MSQVKSSHKVFDFPSLLRATGVQRLAQGQDQTTNPATDGQALSSELQPPHQHQQRHTTLISLVTKCKNLATKHQTTHSK